MKKVIILGCGGFVGSHLTDRLLASGDVHVEGWDVSYDKISQHLDDPRLSFHQRYIFAHNVENGMPFTMIRPYNWFGARMDFIPGRDGEGVPRVLACFMTALLDDKPISSSTVGAPTARSPTSTTPSTRSA
ncbi:MAG: hypothetical protein CL910_22480 [Deltaproteobacteria bacterium]|jgi:hypothetical protein|nr:hypothetical protein [Deltaproteobacteria bacterium]